jgi:hypothetical protein
LNLGVHQLLNTMQSLSAADILYLWERGASRHPIDRALLVLSHALPEPDINYLAALPLGKRDLYLLEVRQQCFGDLLEAYTECPQCQERLEFSLSCAALKTAVSISESLKKTVTIDGIDFELRCPDSVDAAACAASESVEAAIEHLLARCVSCADDSVAIGQLMTTARRAAISEELAALDPQAEVLVNLACPACKHDWQEVFDVITFIWMEIRARARRLLQEVDALARVYGWSETDILAMSAARRGLYLEMAVA